MERNTQKNGLINLLLLVLVASVGFGVARYCHTLAGQVVPVFMGIGALVAAVSWFQMRLENRERIEKLEFDELRKSATSSTLFNTGESEVFPAQRSREQFERFVVPVFTVILFIIQVVAGGLILRGLLKAFPLPTQNPAVSATFFVITFLILFLVGRFSSTMSRLENLRLLRPGATHLLFCAFLCVPVLLAVGIPAVGGPKSADLYIARGLSVVMLLTALETLVNLVLEIYRPRLKGKVERPVYESRLVSLLGQPQGLITTLAQTLDYQFGFKVSETWFYRFFRQAVFKILFFQLAVLLASTCIVFIDTGEQALLERFGQPVAGRGVLGPGAHLKLPWPIDHVYRYPTDQIQSFNLGFMPDPTKAPEKTVLWTSTFNKEENFLVATRDQGPSVTDTNNPSAKRAPPVGLLTMGIPVQYQITNLEAWAYNNEDPSGLLQHVAMGEVDHYFVGVDLQETMSRDRGQAADIIRERIQTQANRLRLGANIVFVGLQDIHPPVKVAPDYEKVVAAIHTKEASILTARAAAIRTNAFAQAQAFRTVSEAQSDRLRREMDARARAAAFTNQIPAYEASPSVYTERAYLQTFAQSVGKTRKYIILATNTSDVIILNLEEKLRPDIESAITVPPPKK